MKTITPLLGLFALSVVTTSTAPAVMQTATAFDLEVIDTEAVRIEL